MMMSREKPLCKKCIADQFTAVQKVGITGQTSGETKPAVPQKQPNEFQSEK